jgi:26S proteasome regulatory subunit N1
MTSIPKPLKFLRVHFNTLKNVYETMKLNDNKKLLANILSILAMTQPSADSSSSRLTLKYKLESDNIEPVGSWGHEYVRHLSGEIGLEYEKRLLQSESTDELNSLVDEVLPFFISHNCEYDAIDLLTETEQLDKLPIHITLENYTRVCLYLLRAADYLTEKELQNKMLTVAYTGYKQFEQYADALRVAIKLNDKTLIEQLFNDTVNDASMQLQLAHILGSCRVVQQLPDCIRDNETLMTAAGNSSLNTYFHQLAVDLDVKDAKTPEDIYKSHLEDGGPRKSRTAPTNATNNTGVDSAKQNLASTFVNAFVNCGFGSDLLITPEGSDWLYKNKSHGMLSATASLGMLMLWDVDSGFSAVDRYSFSAQAHIKAGAALAHGLLSTGVTSEMDAAQALLTEHLESKDNDLKLSAIFG